MACDAAVGIAVPAAATCLVIVLLLLSTVPAAAHGAERGFVLLLPTGHALVGGALAVAASFLVTSVLPAGLISRLLRFELPIGRLPAIRSAWPSTTVFLLSLALLAAGFFGIRDPLANPLPLAVWTAWWVVLPLLQAVVGDLWSVLNPFVGPYRLLDRALGGRLSADRLPLPSRSAGFAVATVTFAAFAWFELIYPAPDDPGRLAVAVSVAVILTFALVCTYGEGWLSRGDPFTLFFGFLAGLSPIGLSENGDRRLVLRLPGTGILSTEPLPRTGVLFVLLTLASVSFDGLSRSFWWLALYGVNPLEFPGRSAMTTVNTLGLAAAFAVLAGVFVAAVALGGHAAGRIRPQDAVFGREIPLNAVLGRLVFSILPISLAFHFAHYLTVLLVNGQYVLLALDDPFGLGLDLLGLRHAHVTTSFLSTASGSRLIWAVQTGAVVLGHIVAVVLAHALALSIVPERRRAFLLEAPLALVMVLYTVFGLWLLSTPVVG